MHKIVNVEPLTEYLLRLTFSNGTTKTVNILPFIGAGVSKALLEEDYFRQVSIESGGGIFWPNGYDFCPEFLYEEVPDVSIEPA